MPDNVSDISRESAWSRALRTDSLAGMMLIVVLISLINGMIIGLGIATLNNSTQAMKNLQTAYEVNSIYMGNLDAWLRSQDLDPPPLPPQLEGNKE